MDEKVFAGKYRAERELSEGATGRTWLAVGPGDSRVVVKVVHPVDAAAAAALEHDVALISGIRNPGLPMIHEWGHEASDFFVVREYVPGADLELELGQQERFAPLSVARYGILAADALGQIHRRGLMHGNVKSANLIRTPEDEIKLVGSSLGLAGPPATGADAPPAAAYYLAPEQVEGGVISPATDVYALGVVLYELLTGHVPFDGPTAAAVADRQAHEVPEAIDEAELEAPPALVAVIMKALEKAPEARFADGDALKVALEDSIRPKAAPAAAVPAPRKSSLWPWVIGILLLLALGLGAAWALGAFGAPQATVPNLVGMTQSDASVALATAGLNLGDVTFAGHSVTGVADGSVSSQTPAEGAKVDPSSKVNVVLGGVEAVTVPDVVGMTETQATIKLRDAGLVAGTITSVASSSVSAGMVLEQTPVAGASVAKGTAVDLQISQNSADVPDVTNTTQADAETTLKNAGFVVAVTTRSSSSVASGRVIEQNPTAGVTAKTGATVTIVVSTGAGLVTVPNVGGMTQVDAVNALTTAGFKSHVNLQTGGGTVGTVVHQSPAANAHVAAGTTVVITVVQ